MIAPRLIHSVGSRKVRTASAEKTATAIAKAVTLSQEKVIFSVLLKNRKVIAKQIKRKVVSRILLFLGYRSVPRSDSRKIASTVKDAQTILAMSTTNRWYVSIVVRTSIPAMAVR